MPSEFVTIKQLADQIGMDRSHARRYVLKLGIEPKKRRSIDSGGQLTLTLTDEEAELVRIKRREEGFLGSKKPVETGIGVFYIIQLVPELDPLRVKLGYADDLHSRLAQHRTAAPTAKALVSWPCKRSWETTVMDALVAQGCRLIMNEVFECESLDSLVEYGNRLFAVLPAPQFRPELSTSSPHNT